ncbi:MAG: hypothetical protein ACOY46_15915 [Bacillota bacterium]
MTENGNLTVQILWLDQLCNPISTGLGLFIPNGRINPLARLTYFDITDRPPAGAAWARILFSKQVEEENDAIDIDQVILTPVNTINFVSLYKIAWRTVYVEGGLSGLPLLI